MSTPIVFVDTETDGLHPGRRAWEVALIRRDEQGQTEHHMFLPLDLKYADPMALKIGGYWDRHPAGRKLSGKDTDFPCAPVTTAHEAAKQIMRITFGAHIIGANPSFDTQILDRLLRCEGYLPQWNYHLLDVETIAIGWLLGQGFDVALPYKSDVLAERCGVTPPSKEDRHTAMSDARWVMRWYDAMTGGVA